VLRLGDARAGGLRAGSSPSTRSMSAALTARARLAA
jgi:hypothetical protein